jgi:GT2 family glycosyltransferase
VAVFSTCNGSIKRQAFDRVGGFDESFRGASYGDDADLALRLSAQGQRIVYDPHAWLVHLKAPAGGLRLSDPASPFSEYDKCLSGLIFVFRHAGREDLWPVLYGWVLRRSVLLRRNVLRPWRQPMVAWGLLRAARDAWRAVRQGPGPRTMRPASSEGSGSVDT